MSCVIWSRKVRSRVLVNFIKDDMDCLVKEVFGSMEDGGGREGKGVFVPICEVREALA